MIRHNIPKLSSILEKDDVEKFNELYNAKKIALFEINPITQRRIIDEAAYLGAYKILKSLAEQDIDLSVPGHNGWTTLHYAVAAIKQRASTARQAKLEKQQLRTIKKLVRRGLSFATRTNADITPISLATNYDCQPVLDYFKKFKQKLLRRALTKNNNFAFKEYQKLNGTIPYAVDKWLDILKQVDELEDLTNCCIEILYYTCELLILYHSELKLEQFNLENFINKLKAMSNEHEKAKFCLLLLNAYLNVDINILTNQQRNQYYNVLKSYIITANNPYAFLFLSALESSKYTTNSFLKGETLSEDQFFVLGAEKLGAIRAKYYKAILQINETLIQKKTIDVKKQQQIIGNLFAVAQQGNMIALLKLVGYVIDYYKEIKLENFNMKLLEQLLGNACMQGFDLANLQLYILMLLQKLFLEANQMQRLEEIVYQETYNFANVNSMMVLYKLMVQSSILSHLSIEAHFQKRIELLKKLVEKDCNAAKVYLAKLYLTDFPGKVAEKNDDYNAEAEALYLDASKHGNVTAILSLYSAYNNKILGNQLKQNVRDARIEQLLQLACIKNVPIAQYRFALFLLEGRGKLAPEQQINKAIKLLEYCIIKYKMFHAMTKLAVLYIKNLAGKTLTNQQSRDVKAIKLLEYAHNLGDKEAINELISLCISGRAKNWLLDRSSNYDLVKKVLEMAIHKTSRETKKKLEQCLQQVNNCHQEQTQSIVIQQTRTNRITSSARSQQPRQSSSLLRGIIHTEVTVQPETEQTSQASAEDFTQEEEEVVWLLGKRKREITKSLEEQQQKNNEEPRSKMLRI